MIEKLTILCLEFVERKLKAMRAKQFHDKITRWEGNR